MKFKGSEWKRWDLHFHTPASYDYGYKAASNKDIIDEMKRNGISAFAITDHHIIDVEKLKDLQKIGVAQGITVLPGIEFLSDANGREPVHFIGIFSESSNIDHIWGQLKNRTKISEIDGIGKKANEVYCHQPFQGSTTPFSC